MDYQKYSNTELNLINVNRNSVEFNNTIIQILNIVTTTVGAIVLPFTEPEPKFDAIKPKFSLLTIISWLILSFIIWIILKIHTSEILAYAISVILFLLVFHVVRLDYAWAYEEWESKKRDFQKKWDIWNEFKTNPPVIHELSIITNATVEPFNFISYNKSQIDDINHRIKDSIENLAYNPIDSQDLVKSTEGISRELESLRADMKNLDALTKSIYEKALESHPMININGDNNGNISIGGQNNKIKTTVKKINKPTKEIPLQELAADLRILINELQKNQNNPESLAAIGPLKAAEMCAEQNKKEDSYKYLKLAGKFSLSVAEKLGLPLALEALKIALFS